MLYDYICRKFIGKASLWSEEWLNNVGGYCWRRGMQEQAGVLGICYILVWMESTWAYIPTCKRSSGCTLKMCAFTVRNVSYASKQKNESLNGAIFQFLLLPFSHLPKTRLDTARRKMSKLELKNYICKIQHIEAKTPKWQTLRDVDARVKSI